jgi:hypothetical protein
MAQQNLGRILSAQFPASAVENVLEHYGGVVSSFSASDWEETLSKTGKFAEAVLRCLRFLTTGELVDKIEVGPEINRLEKMPKESADETVRLLIPRVLRPLYQVACNRGARHDRLNFDPNAMDATLAVQGVSWVLAELVRFGHPGVVEPAEAQRWVGSIVEPKFSEVEEVDGITFFHRKHVSARDALLVKLRLRPGQRVSRTDLVETACVHGHSVNNARVTLSLLKRARLVHENPDGVRLLAPGLREADALLKNGQA